MWLTSANTPLPGGSNELSKHVISYRQSFKRNEINSLREIADSVTGRLQEDSGSSHGKMFPGTIDFLLGVSAQNLQSCRMIITITSPTNNI
jgi:hypothetical protein